MPLTAGDKLGPYEILELIGKGGMGEVYSARDSRLNRDVAIKISAEQFSERFAREAKIIASLNHPSICTLFDVGPNYLVMEMVEGPTLTDRMREGALSLDAASGIARQIADALDYAHEKSIVHRDLKPGNVKIRPDGVVKVLDFGLAKAGGGALAQSDNSPTVTIDDTQAGMILGTAAYMAPEQALGKTVDKRADIWAFGVVFYEMLNGSRLHKGDTLQETITSVLRDEPNWEKVPGQTHRLLKRCLEKDPQKRLRHIGDVMSLLDDVPSGQRSGVAVPLIGPTKRMWLWPVVAAAAVLAAGLLVWAPWRAPADLQAIRFEIPSTDKVTLVPGGTPTISPDGRWIVFPAKSADGLTRLWLRALDSVEARPLAGTESENALPPPAFWSPDSKSIVFSWTSGPFAPGKLKKVDVSGGTLQTICDIPMPTAGVAWNRNGVILIGSVRNALSRVSATGGVAVPLAGLDPSHGEVGQQSPQFLPDGRHFLYFRNFRDRRLMGVYASAIDAKPEEQSPKLVMLSDSEAFYAPPSSGGGIGLLLFLRDTTLFAQPFDPARLELSGTPTPVSDLVGSFMPANHAMFSVSETGTLAYRVGAGSRNSQLTWFDDQGHQVGTLGDKGIYFSPAVSPDGTRVAVSQLDPKTGSRNIWVLDVSRGTVAALTFGPGRNDTPVWSPDGKSIMFASNRGGHMDLYQKPSDGSGEETLILKTEADKFPTSWSRDGRFLLYVGRGLWILPLEGDRKPISFLSAGGGPIFSPDGRWIAYMSNESGSVEIFVRPFSPDSRGASDSGGKWMVSKGGVVSPPRWRADGRALFYYGRDEMAVDIVAGKTFQAGVPRRLFGPIVTNSIAPDVTPDGKRFLFATPEGINAQTPISVVTNWQALLKR